jgi:signal transduction histidine kinase
MNALSFRRMPCSYVKVSIDDVTHLLSTFSGSEDNGLTNVSIRIEDNGIGMSQSFLQQDYFKAMGKQV